SHRVRHSSGSKRNLSAMVRAVLQLGRKRRHELRLHIVRAMHDDRDARLRRLLRAESVVSGLWPGPTGARNRGSAQTVKTIAGSFYEQVASEYCARVPAWRKRLRCAGAGVVVRLLRRLDLQLRLPQLRAVLREHLRSGRLVPSEFFPRQWQQPAE